MCFRALWESFLFFHVGGVPFHHREGKRVGWLEPRCRVGLFLSFGVWVGVWCGVRVVLRGSGSWVFLRAVSCRGGDPSPMWGVGGFRRVRLLLFRALLNIVPILLLLRRARIFRGIRRLFRLCIRLSRRLGL